MLEILAIVTDGLAYAAYLFIVAAGLSLIFGVMKVLNIAHGAFYAFGAYGAATAVGITFARGWPAAVGFASMIVVAMVLGAIVGVALERGLLRFLYGRDEVILALVTYASFLVLEDVIILVWGPGTLSAYQPLEAAGNFSVAGLLLSGYDAGLVAVAAVLAIGTHLGLRHTRHGRLLTAVIFDREAAAAFGVNVTVVFAVTFALGAALGGLAGAVMAPKIAVTLGIGVEVIVLAFAVVAIGGMGSMEGALLGALIVGLCRAATVHLVPQLELFVIFAVMAVVLAFRPRGLFARAQPRRI
jgi:branched-chain amino acid transport system permease protein